MLILVVGSLPSTRETRIECFWLLALAGTALALAGIWGVNKGMETLFLYF